jgi:hypothetical protein
MQLLSDALTSRTERQLTSQAPARFSTRSSSRRARHGGNPGHGDVVNVEQRQRHEVESGNEAPTPTAVASANARKT